MKAILLAGGRGTRISRYIKDLPKCCLLINTKPLIRINVELLLKKGIEVAVCTGYKEEKVHKALKGLNVTYFHNPFYNVTNSMGTLWFANDFINDDEDIIIINADVYFDTKILDKLIASKETCVMAADSSKIETGDFFFKTDTKGCIIKYGKELTLEERTCEYVGMAKIKKSFIPLFKKELNRLIKNNKFNLWWENVLYSLADSKKQIKTIDFAGLFWSEVDYYEEYMSILKHANSVIQI